MGQNLVYPDASQVCDQANSVPHFQLRDLIHAPDAEDSLYFVRDGATRRLHTQTSELETVQDCGIDPTAMTVDHGYTASGTMEGMLLVGSLADSEWAHCGPGGASIINSVHFAKDPGGKLRLFVSNNDMRLRVFDVPSMRLVDNIPCLAPVNYAALSPDGALLACVSDSEETRLYHAAPSGFVEHSSFAEAEDAGFSCAWNASGSCLASGSQDGSLTIWDPRAHKRVARLQTKNEGSGLSACRCVKFGAGPADLLAFNAHHSHTHIVDARNFQQEQIIDVWAAVGVRAGERCALSGLAFTPSGKHLYVGVEGCEMEPHGIVAYDVQMLSRITFGTAELA